MKIKHLFVIVVTYALITKSLIINAYEVIKRHSDPTIEVPINKYPWIVQTNNDFGRWSSGFLINKRYVVTAAHAVDTHRKRKCLTVSFLNYRTPFSIRVTKVLLSPRYGHQKEIFNDIAILELSHTLTDEVFVSNIPKVDFETYSCDELKKFTDLISSGYAMRSELKETHLAWRYSPGCNNRADSPYRYYLSYGGYAENGDSGSPLFYSRNGSYYVLGMAIKSQLCNDCINTYEAIMHNADLLQGVINITQNMSEPEHSQGEWHFVDCSYSTVASTAASTAAPTAAPTVLLILVSACPKTLNP